MIAPLIPIPHPLTAPPPTLSRTLLALPLFRLITNRSIHLVNFEKPHFAQRARIFLIRPFLNTLEAKCMGACSNGCELFVAWFLEADAAGWRRFYLLWGIFVGWFGDNGWLPLAVRVCAAGELVGLVAPYPCSILLLGSLEFFSFVGAPPSHAVGGECRGDAF